MRTRTVVALVAAATLVAGGTAVGILRTLGRSEVPTFETRKAPFSRSVRAEGNLAAVEATPVTAPMDAEGPMRIAWMVPDGTLVKKDDVLIRFDPTDMEKKLSDGEDDRASAESRIEGTRAQAEGQAKNLERDAGMAQRELDYAGEFQRKDEQIFSRNEIIESEIDSDLALRRRDNSDAVKRIRQDLTKVDLDLLAIDRKKADLRIAQARKGLEALEVRAPHDGILVFKRGWNGNTVRVGETVWSGQPIAEIPRLDTMKAEIYVLEADAGGLTPGLPATVTVESSPEVAYKGKIQKVDTLAKRRLRWIPIQYFGVTLELERTDPETMKPGARVQAVLTLDERPEAVAVPRSAVLEKDGKKIVYRKRRWSFEPVEVVLGPSAVGTVVIEKGIGPGDIVALSDPTRPEGEEAKPTAASSSSAPSPGAGGRP